MRTASLACAIVVMACGTHALMGCVASTPRAERTITNVGGVVISNAPAVNEAPEPRAQGERLVFAYGLLAENVGTARAVLDLVSSRAALAQVGQDKPDAEFRITCLEHEPKRRRAPIAVLEPGERTRIDCEVELTEALAAPLASAEREVVLGLPVHTASEHALVYFDYRLFEGDAP
jgi:hypothetical protein